MLSHRPIQMMKMKNATTKVNDTVMRKKTGHHATANQEETRVRQEMTATVREIHADIDHATGLMTLHEVTDPLTESVDRPRSVIEIVTAVTETGMMKGTDIMARIKIVDVKGDVSGLDQGTGRLIASMKSPLEADISKSVVVVIGKYDNFNFVLIIFLLYFNRHRSNSYSSSSDYSDHHHRGHNKRRH